MKKLDERKKEEKNVGGWPRSPAAIAFEHLIFKFKAYISIQVTGVQLQFTEIDTIQLFLFA